MAEAKGRYHVTGWDERPWEEQKGGVKLTHARITQNFEGEITGEGIARYVMAYPTETFSSFVGLHQVRGTIADRSGTFVLQVAGTYTVEEGAVASWQVVPGSGTDGLSGLAGEGGYSAREPATAEITLTYRFED